MPFQFKLYTIISFFIISPYFVYSQAPTVQDCLGAIPICQDFYEEPSPYPYSGTNGSYLNEIYNEGSGCLTSEANGMWYIFTAKSSGMLRFEIETPDPYIDYDWIVFDLTDVDCDILQTYRMNDYMLSSNTYGGTQGEEIYLGKTGANSIESGGTAGNCNGPGQPNGPSWNDDIPVTSGRTYVLYISNWSSSSDGYTLDFSASTAVIFDDVSPIVNRIEAPSECTTREVSLTFNENIVCASVSTSDFSIHNSLGEEMTIIQVESETCEIGAPYGREFTLKTFEPLLPGLYTISLHPHTNFSVLDLCANIATPVIFQFDKKGLSFTNSINSPSCYNFSDGSIQISTQNAVGNVYYSIDGGITFQNSSNFSNLAAGTYDVVVKDDSGCELETQTIVITEPAEEQKAVLNQVPNLTGCSSSSLSFSFTKPIKCSSVSSLDFDLTSATGVQHTITSVECTGTGEYSNNYILTYSPSLSSGNYNLKVNPQTQSSVIDKCLNSAEVIDVDFLFAYDSPVTLLSTNINPSCHNFSDGELIISAGSTSGEVQYSIDGGATFQNSNTFSNLAGGDYSIYVQDAAGCIANEDVSLLNPEVEDKAVIGGIPNIIDCEATSIEIQFSKPILCSSVSPADFSLIADNGDVYTITSITCIDTGEYSTDYELSFSPTLVTGNFSLVVNPVTENSVIDRCILTATAMKSNFSFTYESPVVANLAGQDPSCNNFSDGEISVSATNTTGNIQYSMDGGVSFQNSSTFLGLPAGDYEVFLVDGAGCNATTEIVTLDNPEIEELPQILSVPDTEDCEVKTITFRFTKPLECNTVKPEDFEIISQNGIQYSITEISCDDNNGYSNEFTLTVSPPIESGTYSLYTEAHTVNSLTDRCGLVAEPNQSTFGVFVFEEPEIIDTENTVLYEVKVTAESEYGELTYYSTETGEVNTTGVFSNLNPGNHEIIVTDKNGCQAKTIITVEELILVIPTIFTPNADGYNDTWRIKGIELIPDADIFIYDRWGKLLAQYKGSDPAWDATYEGKPVSSDTYWYVIKVSSAQEYTGHTTVKR